MCTRGPGHKLWLGHRQALTRVLENVEGRVLVVILYLGAVLGSLLTDNRCPRPATIDLFDGEPEICEVHDRLWALSNDLVQAETAQRMLALWQE